MNQLEILPHSSVEPLMMGCFPTPPSFTPPHSRGPRTQPHPLPPLPGVANVQVVGAWRVHRAAAAQQLLLTRLLELCPCSTHGPRPRPSGSPVAGEHQPIPQLQESPQQKGLRGLAVNVSTLQNSHGQGLVWWPPPTFYPRFSMNFIPDSLLLSPVTPILTRGRFNFHLSDPLNTQVSWASLVQNLLSCPTVAALFDVHMLGPVNARNHSSLTITTPRVLIPECHLLCSRIL